MERVIIAAIAENGVIGKDGSLPWHYPEDMEHFRELTTGHAVVMGRVTFEDIHSKLGGPLPDRLNIVLTRSGLAEEVKSYESVLEANSVEEAKNVARSRGYGTLMIAGGSSVYGQFLDAADRMELTKIHEEYGGDSFFPEVDWSEWEEEEKEDLGELSFVTYRRLSS